MALLSLGRTVAVAEAVDEVGRDEQDAAEVRREANEKLATARKSLLDALTPWIPGDFVLTYGTLLTAWTAMRSSFIWMLVIAAVSAIVFVIGGAFAETGFRTARDRSSKVKKRLAARTIAGFVVSVYAAITIPSSGWYDFKWFSDNELPVVMTAAIIVVGLVAILKGFQKRLGFALGSGE